MAGEDKSKPDGKKGPKRKGAFAANFDPDVLDNFRNTCKEKGLQYSKVLEQLAVHYLKYGDRILDFSTTYQRFLEVDDERHMKDYEIDRLHSLLDYGGIPYSNEETGEILRERDAKQKEELLDDRIGEIESLSDAVIKLRQNTKKIEDDCKAKIRYLEHELIEPLTSQVNKLEKTLEIIAPAKLSEKLAAIKTSLDALQEEVEED